jgi:hypothetical protein
MQFQDWKFDKRVCRRNLRRGFISEAELKAYLASLPDVSRNMSPLWDSEVDGSASTQPRKVRRNRDTLVQHDDE